MCVELASVVGHLGGLLSRGILIYKTKTYLGFAEFVFPAWGLRHVRMYMAVRCVLGESGMHACTEPRWINCGSSGGHASRGSHVVKECVWALIYLFMVGAGPMRLRRP
jgi:hypothetical protein